MGKPVTSNEKIKRIQSLREHGYSLPEISKITRVSKTTVYRYIKDVQILPDYYSEWLGKRGGSRKRKNLKEKLALEKGKKLVGNLTGKEKVILLSALYWGEGSKKDFGLSNTDADLIRVFIRGLKEVFKINENRIRVSVRIYEDLDKDKSLAYWSKITGIPKEKFINVDVLTGKKKGKLEYGMCRVRVLKGGDLLKKINGIKKAIIESIAPIA